MKKARKDVSFLCKAVSDRAKEIVLLQTQLDQEIKEKLELCRKVWELEVSSRKHQHVVEDLRVEVVDLNDRNWSYREELHNLLYELRRGVPRMVRRVQGNGA